MRFFIFTLLFIFIICEPTKAVIVSNELSGTIIEIGGKTGNVSAIGDTLTGRFQYSTDSSNYEGYSDAGIFGFDISFGGLTFSADSDDLVRPSIGGPGNQSGFSFSVLFDSRFDLISDGSALVDFNGPVGTFGPDYHASFDLDSLNRKTIEFNYQGYYVRANITAITTTAVPEPSTAILVFFAGALLIVISKYRLTRRCS